MATVYQQSELSTEIVQNLFRQSLQAAADDPGEPLDDRKADERDGDEEPDFVLPSFPDQGALYPHVIVSEAGYDHQHPDARADLTEGEYNVRIRVMALSTTTLNKITDGVRDWYLSSFDTLIDSGFNDPVIAGGGEVPSWEDPPKVEVKDTLCRGTVYTE